MSDYADFINEKNGQFFWQPMTNPQDALKKKPDVIVKGEGCWIWDVNGHKTFDAVAGLWSSNLGHSNQRVRNAIVQQLDTLPFYNSFRGNTNNRAIELSSALVEFMQPEDVHSVMFCNGGSDAVESALKLARQYWKLQGQGDRTKFISLKQGYHGTHFGGASVNGNINFRRMYEPLLPGCFHVETPWLYRNAFDLDDPIALGKQCAVMLEREIIFQGPDTIAAFIAEPVQGAGGLIVPPENYWPLVREICDKYGILLIADEVITGFGRSGEMFGTRLWNVNADIWCLAKGISSGYMPLGATAIGRKVFDVFMNDTSGRAAIGHGYTYSGHPVAAAAAIETLKILSEENIVGNAKTVGAHFNQRLQEFYKYDCVGDVRGIGLMSALELVEDKVKKTTLAKTNNLLSRIARSAYEKGLTVRTSGANMILSPPLILTLSDADYIVDTLHSAFSDVA